MPPFSLMGSIPGISPVSAMEKPCTASSVSSVDSITFHLLPVANAGPRRVITIQRGQTVGIGRSSRDVSKGLSVQADNALFDCPVVSRQHAELLWRPSEEGSDIAIIDASSSHGTFINGKKLEHNKEHVLKSGDEIRLGCEINSNLGAHEGVTFSLVRVGQSKAIDYAQAEDHTRRGFRLYGDDESEMDSVIDDDEDDSSVVMESAGSSNITTPDTKAIPRTAALGSQNQPIDLEQPNLILHNVVDIDDVDDEVRSMSEPPAAGLESHDSRKDAIHAGKQPSTFFESLLGGSRNNELHAKNPVPEEYTEEWYTDLQSIVSDAESDSDDQNDDEDDDAGSDAGRPLIYTKLMTKSVRSDVVSEPYSDDEGPERMSSKKQASPELGDSTDKGPAVKPSETSCNPPRTLHYDPVRGSQPPEPADLTSNESIPKPDYSRVYACSFAAPCADFGPTVRWNVGPTQDDSSLFSEQQSYFLPDYEACRPRRVETPYPSDHDATLQSQYYPYSYSNMSYGAHDQPSGESMNAAYGYSAEPPASTDQLAVTLDCDAQPLDSNIPADSQAVEIDVNISKKRKAADMSQDDPVQVLSDPGTASLPAEDLDVLAQGQALQDITSAPVTVQPVTVIEVIERRPAKRARNVADVARSVVKTATKVIGYTALGGVATAYFLQTPVAEALCEWL